MAKKVVETPLMKQYFEMKAKHPDAILLFRVGDFYETFSEDAISASEILGITLTRRANGYASDVELAGFPHHALDTYLPKLVRAGRRVAICEQLEDPKLTKKLVKRGITELVTPGVVTSDNVLENRENNFVAALHPGRDTWGLALLDISTGEFLTAQGNAAYIDKLLADFAPKEVLIERGTKAKIKELFNGKFLLSELDDWIFTTVSANERLLKQFETSSLKGFGIDDSPLAVVAAGAILHYLDITGHTSIPHIASISRIEEAGSVRLDRFTLRNLEIVTANSPEGRSLLNILEKTATPMGSRLLKRWLLFPLLDVEEINRRLDVVQAFAADRRLRDDIYKLTRTIGDLERLAGKIATGRIGPRDMLQIGIALTAIAPVSELCRNSTDPHLRALGNQLNPLDTTRKLILDTIVEEPPIAVNRGTVIKSGVNSELDDLRNLSLSGQEYMARMLQTEQERTGIPSLKIGSNNIYGFYFEVTHTHRSKVPPEWVRRQTLVNAERYITPELKEYEEKITGAKERIDALEEALFRQLTATVAEQIPALNRNARVLAQLDCLRSFAEVAALYRYTRPVVDDSLEIDITDGRHPVIERELPPGEPYIANSVKLHNDRVQLMMITGPNMAGKSALLRQVALITLMAQAGSFVPARSAHIGIVDKIFTRVGASDNISLGESTFMVEMNEAASILNNMSERSLILFDELGRGTSTYDGISIAWAIAEYIHENPRFHPKTLFATHYHELNEMQERYERIVNFNVAVKEIDDKVIFLRKLVEGGSEHSFGIHVARLAGMPRSIVGRANEILQALEANRQQADTPVTQTLKAGGTNAMQLSFFQLDDPVLTQIRDEILHTDINNLTPMAALNKLHDIKSILTGK